MEEEKKRSGAVGKSNGKIVMATVKGDVHDIGKNIVGVVLACNNFEIIDLGVMVPAQKILDAAIAEKADMIGVSGLITPSLEEMAHVAKEMKRQNFSIPLLIGGATTSRAHTAIKIEPNYETACVWVKDASRAVGVAQSLVSKDLVANFLAKVRTEYAEVRERHKHRGTGKRLVTLDAARANASKLDWSGYTPPAPRKPGITVFDDIPLTELLARHRLDPVLPSVGTARPLSGKSQRSGDRRASDRAIQRRAEDPEADRRGEMAARESGNRILASRACGRRYRIAQRR